MDYASTPDLKELLFGYQQPNKSCKVNREAPSLLDIFRVNDKDKEVVMPMLLTPQASICLTVFLSRYISVYSLHYVRESLKMQGKGGIDGHTERKESGRRFSPGLKGLRCPVIGNAALSHDVARTDRVTAQDLRTINQLRALVCDVADYGFSEKARNILVILSRR